MSDKDVILALGGVSSLARALGYSGLGGVRRVSNWTRRGIPSKVRLENQHVFSKFPKASND